MLGGRNLTPAPLRHADAAGEATPFIEFMLPAMTFDQGQFNFDANPGEEGYRRWREELDERKKAFESRWGIILGTKVLLQLRSHLRPITGVITLIQEKSAAKPRQPHLRIGTIEFCPNEIESVLRINDNP